MMKPSALLALAALSCVRAYPSSSLSLTHEHLFESRTETQACQQLAAKYPKLVSYPNSTTYVEEDQDFYSSSCYLSPWCVFTPESSQDVAGGLKILRATNTQFGVRSGGHMPIKGAASTSDGVLIGMDKITTLQLGNFGNQTVAQISPGFRWGEVYSFLEPYNLIVIGGRYSPVGVGGLLLGGGVSYFGSVRGWDDNHILNYEVVTADSEILQVNANSHPDLFWALKGGSSNFGIVTRFDLETYPLQPVYAGFFSQDAANVDKLIDAIAQYCDPQYGGNLDSKTAIDANLFYDAEAQTLTGLSNIFYNGTVNGTPPAFANFTSLPSVSTTVQDKTFASWLSETTIYGATPSRKLWTATSLTMSVDTTKLAADIFLQEVKTLRNVTNGTFTITWQPISQGLVDNAQLDGGTAIDLDPKNGPILTLLFASNYALASDDAYVDQWLKTLTAKVEAEARARGAFYPFVFLNDAGGWQKTLSYYGGGQSLPKMAAVSQKYDPQGVFQKLASGAFKISQEASKQ